MRISATFLTFVCTLAAMPVLATAQSKPRPAVRPVPKDPRVSIGVNGGYQATTTKFNDSFDVFTFQETLTTRVTYPVDAGFAFDVGGGVRLWRRLGAGLAVSRFARDNQVSATSSIPHPLYLAQPRQVSGDAGGIRREESGIHIQAQYLIPLRKRLEMTLMAGPSILQVNQSVVTSITYTQEYPYDTATFTGVSSRRVNQSAVGFNAGADVRWMFSRSVGVGGVVRFTRATIDLDAAENRKISVDAGGAQVGAGVRLAF